MGNNLIFAPLQVYQGAEKASAPQADSLNLIGVPFDGTVCFRKGASEGPAAIRRVSESLETYSPYLDRDLEEVGTFYDLGDLFAGNSGDPHRDWLVLKDSFAVLTDSTPESSRFLVMGGEHSISCLFIERCLTLYPDMVLLHLDAHADLRDGYQGFDYSHASAIRRCLDHFGPGHRLVQHGIRSGTKDEFAQMRAQQTLYSNLAEFIDYVEGLSLDTPVYLTLDLDYFDPAYLPGTGTPEAGGENFQSFIEIVKVLKEKNLVGADVVELAPKIDPTGNSDVFGAKVVRELILAMHGEGGHVR